MTMQTLAILGTGLIGGSLARAARANGVAGRVVGVEHDPAHAGRALALGIIDELSPLTGPAVARADIVVACTPVDRIAGQLQAVAACCRPGTLLTDVGSTKLSIVRAVEEGLPPGVLFVGSHPLAGSDKSGPEHAGPNLFAGRVVVLTPTARTDPDTIRQATAFWQALGARVRSMSPEDHDRAVALTSHLPHLLASALAGMLPETLTDLAATGFRDMTRLAAGDAALWTSIFADNRAFLLESLRGFGATLDEFRAALESDEAARIAELLERGERGRGRLDWEA
jgi:prephenate dehydrogenase